MSEREIVKYLMESKRIFNYEDVDDLDEKTYTVGDTQYWRRSGKCYKWTSDGGRTECSEDEYMKAISGGSDNSNNTSVKNTDPKDDASSSKSSETKYEPFVYDAKKYSEYIDVPFRVTGPEATAANKAINKAVKSYMKNGELSREDIDDFRKERAKIEMMDFRSKNGFSKWASGIDKQLKDAGMSPEMIKDFWSNK